jgi:tetratricopeptide (TPR) repeat protein
MIEIYTSTMRMARLSLLVAVALSAFSPTVWAQPDAPEKVRALELFSQSDEHYKRGEFEQAADLLRQAYDLYPEPLLLYNLARALEGLGDVEGAITQYERYLAEATAIDDRGAIQRRVGTLKAQRAASSGVDTRTYVPTSTPIDTTPRTRSARRLPWFIAGGGLAVVGAGVVFGVMANSKHDAAVDEPVQAEAERLQDQAKSYATTSNVLLFAGGALVIGGVVWGVVELRRSGRQDPPPTALARPRLEIGPTYVGLAWDLP